MSDGRYTFANQASIAGWSIARLAESLLKLISEDKEDAIKLAQDKLQRFSEIYKNKWKQIFLTKLGFEISQPAGDELISDLLIAMFENKLDYTNTFYNLTYKNFIALKDSGLRDWLDKYMINNEINFANMKKTNPVIIPRNNQVEKVLKSSEDTKLGDLYNLVAAFKTPYEFNSLTEKYMAEPAKEETYN